MKRLPIWIALDILLLCTPALAAAADPVTPEATAEASAHFNRGVELYREGNLDAALAEFVRANELAPNFQLLYNMAQVEVERHDYVHALTLLDAYLEQGGTQIPAARRAEVDQERTRLGQRVAALWVSADVDAATLWVNDERVANLPLQKPVMLNPGIAKIRVEADGRKPHASELTVAGGDRPRLELTLDPLPSVPIAPAPFSSDGASEKPSGSSALRVAGIVSGALGAASLGVGIGFGISVKNHADTANAACDGNRCTTQKGVDAAETAATHATIATIGVTAGAGLLVAGTVLWLAGAPGSDPNEEHAHSGVRVAPMASSSELGMALSGRW